MTELPPGWDEYDPNDHERSGDPEYQRARAAAADRAEARRASYGSALAALRRARVLTQASVAETLGVAQPEISRIEHQSDLLLSTMSGYVAAMGGELSLGARFGDDDPIEFELALLYSEEGELALEPVVQPDPVRVARLSYFLGGFSEKERRFHDVAAA